MIEEPPSACAKRSSTKLPMFCASAQPTDAATKTERPAEKRRLAARSGR
jgi:hypothetical protein